MCSPTTARLCWGSGRGQPVAGGGRGGAADRREPAGTAARAPRAVGCSPSFEVAGLLAVIGVRLAAVPGPSLGRRGWTCARPPPTPNLGLAMVFVLLTFGGWSEAAYLSAEVRDRRRGVSRALLAGIAVITVLYLLANAAYLRGLGLAGVSRLAHGGSRPDDEGGGPRRLRARERRGHGVGALLGQRHHDHRRPQQLRPGVRLRPAVVPGGLGRPAGAPPSTRCCCRGRGRAAGGLRRFRPQRIREHGRLHRAGVLAGAAADRCVAVRAAPAGPGPAAPLPGAALSADPAAVHGGRGFHAVFEPGLRGPGRQLGSGRHGPGLPVYLFAQRR